MKLIKMPSIGQFSQAVKDLIHTVQYEGIDKEGNVVYNKNKELPTIVFEGTVKLHGTNASVCYDGENVWAQSKKNIITPEKDNAGFAFFVEKNKEYFKEKLNQVLETFNLKEVCVYGEWVGKGIQKGVSISEIEKSFFIFGIKFLENEDYVWAARPETVIKSFVSEERRIYSIFDYKTFKIEVDLKEPKLSQNKIIELTEEVENCCPVAKDFGVEGIGEGIVWVGWYDDNRFVFKSKGDKHANSKVKKLKKVDNEKINKLIEFANYATPAWRLEQMYQETFDTLNGGKGDIKRTGDFIKSVINDVMKEETSKMQEMNIEPKEVNKYISNISRKWLLEKLNNDF